MSSQKGLTLVEMLIAVAILAIVTAFGLPGFKSMFDNANVGKTTNELISALNFARLEAIRRGDVVLLSSSAGSDWSGQNRIWLDTNNNNVFNNGTDEALKIIASVNSEIAVDSDGANTITFRSDGFVDAAATFTICAIDEPVGRRIEVLISGRVSVDDEFACTP